MYSDKKKKRWPYVVGVLTIALLVLLIVFMTFRNSGKHIDDETEFAIKSVVERTALQCYTVEGAYPSDLEYLKENYGLSINEKNYIVVYEAYASNQPPEIRVVKKENK